MKREERDEKERKRGDASTYLGIDVIETSLPHRDRPLVHAVLHAEAELVHPGGGGPFQVLASGRESWKGGGCVDGALGYEGRKEGRRVGWEMRGFEVD